MTGPSSSGPFEDCLVAGAVGDALGATVEFSTWPDIQRRHGRDGLREMPAGAAFTDDTQMTLFTAEGLIRTSTRLRVKGNTTHIDVGHHALLRWLHTQAIETDAAMPDDQPDGWLITNPVLHQRRAPGNTCLSSLRSGRLGTVDDTINDSKGCGAVMRMAPVGLWYAGHPEMAWEVGCDLAALTHGHPDGYESAGALAAIVARVVAGEPLPRAVEMTTALLILEGRGATSLALTEASQMAGAGAVDPDDLCAWFGEGWVGDEALALAISSCLAHDDPLEALLMAVNHRGDSDSTGSIAGNLLGAIHGPSWLPAGWADAVPGIDLVRTVASDLWCESHEPPPIDGASAWLERYPGD